MTQQAGVDVSALWDLGLRSVQELRTDYGLNASEADTGLFAALFGRDSLWTILLALDAAHLRRDAEFTRWVEETGCTTLGTLASLQGTKINDATEEQPGKLLHEYHPGGKLDRRHIEAGMPFEDGCSYSGFDQTFLFVTAFKRFAEAFPDNAELQGLWPNVERALHWIETYGDDDGDGLFEYHRRDPRNLRNQVWKDSFDSITGTGFDSPRHPLAWVEVQGYAFRAFEDAARLHSAAGRRDAADYWAGRARVLRRLVNDLFWMEQESCFAMALDGDKKKLRMVGSNPGHALWAGLVDGERSGDLVDRLFRPDVMTAYGLRTLSSRSHFYAPFAYHRGNVWPFDNAIFAAGLLAGGFERHARDVMEGVSRALLAAGTPLEVYVVLDADIFLSPRLREPALAFYKLRPPSVGRRLSPQNRNQAWTTAAMLFFAAALAEIYAA